MASNPIPVLFLLSFVLLVVLADEATADKMIGLNSSLSAKGNPSSWVSSSGHFAFGFYPYGDGYAVGIWLVGANESENTVVWTANRDDPPVSSSSTLQLTKDGLLLRQGGQGTGQHIANISKPAAVAFLLDSGNFVIHGQGKANTSYVVWQSFDHPTDTILGGQNLTLGSKLVSSLSISNHSSGRFYLLMQTDANLVDYTVSSDLLAYWDYGPVTVSDTGSGPQLSLNLEGFLCLSESGCLANNTNPRKKSQNITLIYRATLDVDGNWRLYEHQFGTKGNAKSVVQTLWKALPDECQIKGFCGFNSYCSNKGGKAVCQCYPGFVPSDNSSSTFLDCKLNYSKADCENSTDPILLYNVTPLDQMSLGDYPYSLTSTTLETCEKSCKEDCDCGGVLYTKGSCNKYRLPLRFGRKVPNTSATALFKVPSGYTISPPMKPKPIVIVDNKRSLISTLAFTLGSIALLCVVSALSIFFIYRCQVYSYTKLSTSSDLRFTKECSLRSFSFDELAEATGGFTEEVGRGSFGAVYRGTIGDSNRRIAVKRLEKIVDEGEREFRAEITAIARTHHRNLVKLIGFCIDDSRKLLVYEYVSNGSLANLLFKAKKHLPWKERLKIALDVARGVQYLHEKCDVCIIHCNLKPQNILMDEAWTAKISDFGFARLLKPEHSRIRQGDEGTSEYLAPEWKNEASSVSAKVDIYSYGVVLLEIVCRRRSIDLNASSPEEILLSSWVYQCFVSGQLNKLVACEEEEDKEQEEEEDEEEDTDEEEDEDVVWKTLERMVKVGLWCVQDDPSLRPSMKNVILMLEGLKDISIPPSPALLV